MFSVLKNLMIDRLGQREDVYEWRTFQTPLDPATVSSICILHTDDKLGDAVLNSALVDGLSRFTPHIKVTIGTSLSFAPYWKSNPSVSNVVTFPQRGVGGMRSKVKGIKEAALPYAGMWDLLVCYDSFNFFDSFLLISELRAKTVIGFNKNTFRLFDYSLDDFRYGTQKRHVKHRVESILGVLGVTAEFESLEQWLDFGPENDAEAESVVKQGTEGQRRLLFNTYGASPDRTLTNENIVKMIRSLDGLGEKLTVFLSVPDGGAESVRASVQGAGFENVTGVIVPPLSGYFSLFALISKMDFVVTPDTAVGHLAAAFEKPQVCLFRDGTYNPIHWMPVSEVCHAVVSTSGKDVNDLDWAALVTALKSTIRP